MTLVELWARAFGLTVLVETIVVASVLARPESLPRRVAAAVIANLASHPVVWFVILRFGLAYEARHAVAEVWAVGSELALYRLVFPALSWRRIGAASLLGNGASSMAGFLARAAGVQV